MKKTVYILLPVHNRRETTLRFIRSLLEQTSKFKLFVIDDGSEDGTADAIRRQIPAAYVIKGGGNLWWAGSLQLGLNQLRSCDLSQDDVILIINDDVIIPPDFLETGVQHLQDRADTLILARIKDSRSGEILETGIEADLVNLEFKVAQVPERINCLSTRGLFLKWGSVQRLGGFHPWLLPHYYSDYEFTLRANRCGLTCVTYPDLYLEAFFDSSGYRNLEDLQRPDGIRRYFSKRCPMNPIYRFSFVILACRLQHMPRHFHSIYLDLRRTLIKIRKSTAQF